MLETDDVAGTSKAAPDKKTKTKEGITTTKLTVKDNIISVDIAGTELIESDFAEILKGNEPIWLNTENNFIEIYYSSSTKLGKALTMLKNRIIKTIRII